MSRFYRLLTASSLAVVSFSAAAGLPPPVSVDAPSTVSLMGLGLVGAILMARYFKR
jgi:hypothetical protein